MSKQAKIGLFLLILLATALRLRGVFVNTFQADEALFATWARLIAVWRDPLLANQVVDKPPLLFYLQALFYPLLGPTEIAARLPNLIASILLIPLTGMLTWRLFRNSVTALIAAAIITTSPLLVQFSATGYTDPLLSALALASILFASSTNILGGNETHASPQKRGRWAFLSGLVFGLALATKYQALLLLPLLAGLFYIFRWKRALWFRWLAGFSLILLVIVVWDLIRSDSPSIFNAQISSYGGLRFIWSWELWPRLRSWAEQWRFLLGTPFLAISVLVLTVPFLGWVTYLDDEFTAIDQLLTIFVLGYFIFHWLAAVPIWDRYLLLVAPYFSILAARMVWRVYSYVKSLLPVKTSRNRSVNSLVLLLGLLVLVIQGPDIVASYDGELPVGGRPDADGGISEVADFIKDEPPGTVLYDHWYSWQWRYHLFESNVYVSWFPNPEALADDLLVFGQDGNARYLALPKTDDAIPVVRAVLSAGFNLEPVTETDISSIELFKITSQ